MSSEVQICNRALLEFGDLTITALTDDTDEGRFCKVYYPQLRDLLLYLHPWNFAMTRADLTGSVISDAPPFEWAYAYTLPTEPPCLRAWELYGTDAEWIVEGGQLLTNLSEDVFLRYIAQITESGKFTPAFVECLALLLASKGAARLAEDDKRSMLLLEQFNKVALPKARSLNAMEGNRPKRKGEQGLDQGNFSFQTEGH